MRLAESIMIRLSSFVLATVAIAALACARTRYAYAPITTTSAELIGQPAAEYPFPPGSPHGRLRLATFGMVQIAHEGPRFVHVRMSATNQGTEPWVIETREQVLEIALGEHGERSTRTRAAVDVAGSPARLEIPTGKTDSLDLFFPLPPGDQDPAEIPAFKVLWTVRESDRLITMATPFTRFLASSPALGAPRPRGSYPPSVERPPRSGMPGTPDTRWPQPERTPEASPLPDTPLP